tara:strand:+ start:154 stop:1734 length:1581 start_codon:yes stop_codon:yes gene_type:complete
MQPRPEDLGKMAENTFVSLCKQAGFIANTSNDDKGGWDVEVETFRDGELNFSNHSYPVCRVQVKSSSKKKGKVRVTFSNLLNLIQYNGASFIIYFEYSTGEILPDTAYLLEIDKGLSRDVLVAAREREVSNKNFKINKNEYTIIFQEKHKLTSFSGDSLSRAISKYIGRDFKSYVLQKMKYLNEFEKETGRWGYTFSIDGQEDNIKNLNDAFLGYDVDFVGTTQMYSTTMGVRDSKNVRKSGRQPITIKPVEDSQPSVDIHLSLEKNSKSFSFKGKLFSSPKFIPKELEKHRIKSTLFSVTLENRMVDGEFVMLPNIEFVDIYNKNVIAPLKDFFLFLDMFNTSKQHDRFYLTLGSDKSSVSIELKYTYSSLPSIFDDFYLGVKALYKKSIELNLENESIASDELLEKYRALPILDSLEHKYIPKAQFEFGKELIREANMIDIASVDSVIFDLRIHFTKKVLSNLIVFEGAVEPNENGMLFGSFDKHVHLKDLVFDIDNTEIEKSIDEATEKLNEKLQKEGRSPLY